MKKVMKKCQKVHNDGRKPNDTDAVCHDSEANDRPGSANEEGVALIAVVSILMLIAVLAASLSTVAVISKQESKVTCDMEASVYIAEGVVDRTIWLLRNDRAVNNSRNLGDYDYLGEEEETLERFMADGIKHSMDYYGGKAVVKVVDAATGKDISGSSPERDLRLPQTTFEDDYEKWERYNEFLRALQDYVDRNDFVNPNGGLEVSDYEELGLSPLPRNNKLEYREEILLIPGAEEFVGADRNGIVNKYRIIPPLGLRRIGGKENLFSADKGSLMTTGGLTAEEADEVIAGLNQYENERLPLEETIDENILSTVRTKYSTKESGVYTIYVDARPADGLPGKLLSVTIEVPNNLTRGREMQFYEWRFLK